MKKFVLGAAALISLNVGAMEIPAVITGTATDIVCGEMDPFAVGDACIVFTTDEKTGLKLGLVFGDYDWASIHVPEIDSPEDLIGDRFEASTCQKIMDPNAIGVLKDYNSDYFYLDCYVYDFNWLYANE